MDVVLSASLHGALIERLDYDDRLEAEAEGDDDDAMSMLLDRERHRLTAALRDLLGRHRPDHRVRCPQIWTTTDRHLITVEHTATPTSTARHATPADHTTGAPSVSVPKVGERFAAFPHLPATTHAGCEDASSDNSRQDVTDSITAQLRTVILAIRYACGDWLCVTCKTTMKYDN